jgi:hypothetical protein
MDLELTICDSAPIAPAKQNSASQASIVARYISEAIIFGFLAGAIGYGIQVATGWDATLSYVTGIGLVACVYFVYLTRTMGFDVSELVA